MKLSEQQIKELADHKNKQLEIHLRLGNPITARLAEKLFGISGTGFHRTLNRFKTKGMILFDEWCEHAGSRFKRYFIDESQNATKLTKSRVYFDVESELAKIDVAFDRLKS